MADAIHADQSTPGVASLPTCPLCHTVDHTVTPAALAIGASWSCLRCSQRWDAARLATAAAYARYVATH